MIYTIESLEPQLKQLVREYPELSIIEIGKKRVCLHGNVLVFREHNGFTLRKKYCIDIIIPLDADELPYVIDSGKQIESGYHHYYPNGMLCLETDSRIRIRFIDGFDLVMWMFEYVEVYFFSYEYYKRFGVFPFGDREHGSLGIIQTYKDMLKTQDEMKAYQLMHFIAKKDYRGHHLCPCGSGDIIRNCHGITMFPFYQDARIRKILQNDFHTISKEVAEINGRKR